MTRADLLRGRIRWWLSLFLVGLILSGATAIPLAWELDMLTHLMGAGDSGLTHWIGRVRDGLHETDARYPFLAYGTDWLAFGHLMIAVAFLGPLRDPVRNRWVLTFGMIACVCAVGLGLRAAARHPLLLAFDRLLIRRRRHRPPVALPPGR